MGQETLWIGDVKERIDKIANNKFSLLLYVWIIFGVLIFFCFLGLVFSNQPTVGKLADGRSVARAVGVGDRWQVTGDR